MLGGKIYTALNLKLTEREELYLFKVKAKQIYSVAIIIHLVVYEVNSKQTIQVFRQVLILRLKFPYKQRVLHGIGLF